MENDKHEEKHHIVEYFSHAWIWVILLILTTVTVTIAGVELRSLTVVVAMLVATIKATVVAVYFMHLKFDNKIFAIMFGIVLLVFASFTLVTFLDYSLR